MVVPATLMINSTIELVLLRKQLLIGAWNRTDNFASFTLSLFNKHAKLSIHKIIMSLPCVFRFMSKYIPVFIKLWTTQLSNNRQNEAVARVPLKYFL